MRTRFVFRALALGSLVVLGSVDAVRAQTAHISEETRSILTYPYSDPNPVPILTKDERLWPYHTFQSYTNQPEMRDWTVVVLENDYIQVFVLPEVGGKVWGAVEKRNGHEFIYRNEVLKFRNISLRGPWTSGGIEFNFGIIGHTPSTATPVDYVLQTNDDGSVSCTVGAMDLPSRTNWRVEIRLPAAAAYFETRALWTNPTPLNQAYYNWMTAAAFARDDLTVSFPGDKYLRHSGEARPWPVDEEGRTLSVYHENDFGSSKSYHVVGEYNDFFGGYYADAGYGFGHWSPYSDMPGQKLWLWALSRAGGIWEDLLTDTDGQYIEFQAGRLFVQYSPGSHINPITQAAFEPYATDTWTERWFPVEGIGGLDDASPLGAMSVRVDGSTLRVGLNAFEVGGATVVVRQNGGEIARLPVEVRPLEASFATVPIDGSNDYVVEVPELDLAYSSDPSGRSLSRSFKTDRTGFDSMAADDRAAFDGAELMKARRFREASKRFADALEANAWNRKALLGQAEILLREGLHIQAGELVDRALQFDAYDAEANFLSGLRYRALNDAAGAREAFGWAERSMRFRAAANIELAEMALRDTDFADAARRANRALDYDRFNASAQEVLAIVARLEGDSVEAERHLGRLLDLDPLHHAAYFERFLLGASAGEKSAIRAVSRSEFPEQIFLEAAVSYVNRGRESDAIRILELGRELAPSQLGSIWLAWLYRDDDPAATMRWVASAAASPQLAKPYRTETLAVLHWLAGIDADWRWRYLEGLNLWALDRRGEAAEKLSRLENRPDDPAFYAARAALLSGLTGADPEADLKRAVSLNASEPAFRLALVRYYQEAERWGEALDVTRDFRQSNRGTFNMDVLHARSLLELDRPGDALDVLASTQVLPSEGSAGGHVIYERAHLAAGLDALESGKPDSAVQHFRRAHEWPENLGAGRPFDPDERLIDFALALALSETGDRESADAAFRRVLEATLARLGQDVPGRLPGLIAARILAEGESEAEIRRELENAAGPIRHQNEYAMAVWTGDDRTAGRLREEHPDMKGDAYFRYLLRLLARAAHDGSNTGLKKN